MFFLILFAILLILAIGGSFYLVRAFHRFSFVQKIAEKHPKIAWMISFVPIAILVIVGIFNVFTGIVSAIHLIIIWMLFDAVGFILRKITHSPRKHYYAGAFAMIFTTLLMCYAWIVAHQVVETDYTLFTEKDLGQEKLRIVQIADAHLGVTLNGSEFAAEMKKINDLHPDLVTVVGDFVDDDTSREDMETAVKALGEISSSYGTFYVFGNQDRQRFPCCRKCQPAHHAHKPVTMSKRYILLAIIFNVCLIASNLFETKIFAAGPLTLTGGLLIFPILYIINDCLTEIWGFRNTRFVILTAFGLNLFVVGVAQIVKILPPSLRH